MNNLILNWLIRHGEYLLVAVQRMQKNRTTTRTMTTTTTTMKNETFVVVEEDETPGVMLILIPSEVEILDSLQKLDMDMDMDDNSNDNNNNSNSNSNNNLEPLRKVSSLYSSRQLSSSKLEPSTIN